MAEEVRRATIRSRGIAELPYPIPKAAMLDVYVAGMVIIQTSSGGRHDGAEQAPHANRRRLFGTMFTIAAAVMLAAFGLAELVIPGRQEPVSYRAWQGPEAGTSIRDTQVATTNAEWHALWSGLRRDPVPAFDASRQTGVAILLGRRPTPGYQIDVLGTEQRGDRVIVVIEEAPPANTRSELRRRAHQPANSSPYAILLINSRGAPVSVEQRVRD